MTALRRENVDVPAGTADRGATEALVRVAARGRTAADIAEIPVKRPSGKAVLVRDVAQVIDGVEEPKNAAFLDERPALALDIQKQSGANTVAVADGVLDAVEKLKKDLPPGVTLSIIKDDSKFIRESIEDVNTTMLIGGLLTIFIVFLFLNSWRSTVITGVTLPISVVAGFIAMRIFGFTLNVLTLMGLSLAIGMLIDDAIVVRENIVRHLQRGKDHLEAARDGTAEIGLAVMATTFTIIAVFMPVSFMGGMVGRFFYEFGITVAAAVIASLFVSFTLDPMLSSRWVDPDIEKGYHPHLVGRTLKRFNDWFEDLHGNYERLLGWALQPSPGRGRRSRSSPSWPASRSSPSSAATSCPTSTAVSTRSRSGPPPGRPSRETKERAIEVVRPPEGPPRRRLHLHHDRRGRNHPPAADRRRRVREAQTDPRQDLQPGARRRPPGGGGGAGAHLRLHRGRPLRPEAAPVQRARTRGGRARPHLARAGAGDGEDPGPRGRRDLAGEEQAGAPSPVRPRPRRRSRLERRARWP